MNTEKFTEKLIIFNYFLNKKKMKNIELYKYFSEKIKKYNSENEEKIWYEVHSSFDLKWEWKVRIDIYSSRDMTELREIFLSLGFIFSLKIFKKYPKFS